MHPAVKSHIKNEIEQVTHLGNYSIVILEAALLIEEKYPEFCDEVWYIYVPSPLRKERLASGRGYSEQKSNGIMRKQFSEEEFFNKCDCVIKNDGSLLELEQQLKERFGKLRKDV